MKKIIVVFGGVVEGLEASLWQAMATRSDIQISFGCSRWAEYPAHFDDWINSRLVFENHESQSDVAVKYRGIAEKFNLHPEETRPFNTLMMWHKWREISKIDGLDAYDYVIKTRSDVGYSEKHFANLSTLLNSLKASRFDVAIPDGGDHRGGLNDVFAVGCPAAMKCYLSILDRVEEYYSILKEFHPERMLRYHLINSNKIRALRFPLELSLRGTKYNADSHKTFLDKLPIFPSYIRKKIERVKRQGKLF